MESDVTTLGICMRESALDATGVRRRGWAMGLAVACLAAACGGGDAADDDAGSNVPPPSDAEARDAGSPDDATRRDAVPISDADVHPDVVWSDVAPPDVTLPDVTLPDVTLPDTSLPDTSLPDVLFADVAPSDVALADAASPDVMLADVAPPDAALPDAALPDAVPPDIAMPPDAAPSDAAPSDAAPNDTAFADASWPDPVLDDAEPPDSAPPDAALDAAWPDAAPPDAAEPDAAEPDAAEPDAAEPDVAEPDVWVPDAAPPPAPQLDAIAAHCNDVRRSLGVHVNGTAVSLAAIGLTLRNADGAVRPFEDGASTLWLALPRDGADVERDGDGFALRFAAELGHDFQGVTSVGVTVRDLAGLESVADAVACTPPDLVALDEICDPIEAFDRCPDGTRCFASALDDVAMCHAAEPPAVDVAIVRFDPLRGALGTVIEGTDPDDDVTSVELWLLDRAFEPLMARDALGFETPIPPLTSPAEVWTDGGRFRATATGVIPSFVVDPAALVAAEVRAVDGAGLRSAPVLVAVEPPLALASGSPCDVAGALGRCPADEVCGFETGYPDAPAVCQVPLATCPHSWPVAELEIGATELALPADPELTTPGRCDARAPTAVFAFTAPTDDMYAFGADAAVLFVRTHCALPQPEYEIDCGASDLAIQLSAGERVYLFVAGPAGPLTVDVSIQGGAP